MSEVRFAVGDADAGLRERLDEEISAFNAAVTGYHDGRMLSVAVRGDGGDLRAGLYGWTWGGCGYIDLLYTRAVLVKQPEPHAGDLRLHPSPSATRAGMPAATSPSPGRRH